MGSKEKKVLVIDDEALIRKIISDELRDEGYQVQCAESAEVAQRVIAAESFDLILSDLKMPGMSGIELLDKINADIKNPPPVIFVTAFSDTMLEEAIKKGARSVFAKPIDFLKLLDKVRLIIGSPE